MENGKSRFHGLTTRDGIMLFLIVVSFVTAFITNRTHVNDELGYVARRITVGEQKLSSLGVRVREIELYQAGSQQQIKHLSEQIAMANMKLDRVLEQLRK